MIEQRSIGTLRVDLIMLIFKLFFKTKRQYERKLEGRQTPKVFELICFRITKGNSECMLSTLNFIAKFKDS